MRRAITIGLTGTTGAGKSTVAGMLKKYGYAVIDADAISRLVTEKGSPLLVSLSEAFGADIIRSDGTLDRPLLASRAFASDFTRDTLNRLMHPEILRLIEKKINGAFRDGYEAVILDAPQLFESGLYKNCNLIISVTAPEEVRLQRIIHRDGLDEEAAGKRMAAQLSDTFFKEHSHIYVENDGNDEALQKKVLFIARIIEEKISGEKNSPH